MERNVLIALSSLAVNNGVASCIMNHYNSIVKNWNKVDFLVLKKTGSPRERIIKENGGKIFELPNPEKRRDKERIIFITELFERENYSVVHVNMPYHNGADILSVSKKLNIPVRLYHVHCPKRVDTPKNRLISEFYTPKCVARATNYLSCSVLASKSIFGNKESIIVHNAISAKKYCYDQSKRDEIRKQYDLKDAFVIGAVGRKDKLKNPYFIVDLFEQIHKLCNNTRLVWLGSGELDDEVERYIDSRGLKEYCLILGSRSDVNEWYSVMDVLVFPSILEGLGMVLIEAQVSGLKCYASENVSRETNLTGLVSFLPLNNGAKLWADEICKNGVEYKRVSRIKDITEAGYNADELNETLSSVYECCLNKNMGKR